MRWLTPQTGSTAETTDPRILRSRRMLMEALTRLLMRKEFDDISVQEIADEATLNRATFYLHYPDKNALLQAMTAMRFRDLIARRGISFKTVTERCARSRWASVTIWPTQPAALASWLRSRLRGHYPGSGGYVSGGCRVSRDGAQPGSQTAGKPRSPGPSSGPPGGGCRTPDRVPAEQMAAKMERWSKPIPVTVFVVGDWVGPSRRHAAAQPPSQTCGIQWSSRYPNRPRRFKWLTVSIF